MSTLFTLARIVLILMVCFMRNLISNSPRVVETTVSGTYIFRCRHETNSIRLPVGCDLNVDETPGMSVGPTYLGVGMEQIQSDCP